MPLKVSACACAMKALPKPGFAVSSKASLLWSVTRPLVKFVPPTPMVGSRYEERTDWWKHIGSVPGPRVLVMQDIDHPPGTGAFFGMVHANILKALGCVGVVTNGAARELPGIEECGFQVFAGRLAISRAYMHVVEYGGQVEVGGLTIQPGELIHGDRHGVLTVPQDLAPELPAVARAIREKKQELIELSKKPGATHEEFSRGLKDLLDFKPDSLRDGAKPSKR